MRHRCVHMRRSIIAILCILGGCHLGPKYQIPTTQTPEAWKTPSYTEPGAIVENWWDIFDDPILKDLELKALKDSPSIYVMM